MKIKNLKIVQNIKKLLKKKDEFYEEIEYYDTLHRNFDKFKLTSSDYDVSERIKLLKKEKFNNNFKI